MLRDRSFQLALLLRRKRQITLPGGFQQFDKYRAKLFRHRLEKRRKFRERALQRGRHVADRGADRAERRVDFVRHARDKLPKRGHFFRLNQLRLRALKIRQRLF